MSESGDRDTNQQSGPPRAVIHKNILDAAANQPDASMKELADGITGATVHLVERVLDEYGDPSEKTIAEGSDNATDSQEQPKQDVGHTMTETNGHQEQFQNIEETLTEKQRETLWAIEEHPEATQAELADNLGVSPATINTRVNSIENFDWERRHEFVEEVLNGVPEVPSLEEPGEQGEASYHQVETSDDTANPELETLLQQVQTLEERLQRLEEAGETESERSGPLSENPELTHKILHACLNSERITEDEELAIVKTVVD